MLKFIDENDFSLVDEFKENDDGSVTWIWDEGEGLPTHSGIIRKGFTRTIQVQNGTETVVVGTEQVQTDTELVVVGQDEEGNDITEEQPVYVTQDVTEEQPVFVDQVIDVYQALLDSGVEIKWLTEEDKLATLAEEVRNKRDALLKELDSVVSNPLRWASLSQVEQEAYATYRQALLDVPQQFGFPTEVVFPTL